ncbi:MAG: hypothetical protein AB7I25_01250 [Vicinamibacterales bacterium]
MLTSLKVARTLIVAAVVLTGLRQTAQAQQFGVRAGASGGPEQFYFGVHADAGPIADRLRFRPNLELGVGDDSTLTAVNLEFVYPVQLDKSRDWSVYPGVGPAFNIVNRNSNTDLRGGLNFILGLAHRDGFFTELKVGALDSPDVKFGVGYTFRP